MDSVDKQRTELVGLPSIPETILTEGLVGTLPPNLAEAPWEVRCTGLVWLGRGGKAAHEALPAALRAGKVAATVGGFVRYADTPVGTYDEVFGLVASREGAAPFGHVAFMAVDSPTSLVGGRTNWAMPKTLSEFSGEPGSTMSARSADGIDWSVTARVRTLGPGLPMVSNAQARQVFPDGRVGTSRLRFRGKVRPALVTVTVESEGPLGTWLQSGRHLGGVIETASFTLGEPRFS